MPTRNIAELDYIRLRRQAGLPRAYRRGWPDFWWLDQEGRIGVTEVKPTACSPLSVSQFENLSALRRAGILTCVYIADDGLWSFDPTEWSLCEVESGGKKRYAYYLTENAIQWKRKIVQVPDDYRYLRALRGSCTICTPSDLPPHSTLLPAGSRSQGHLKFLVGLVLELRRALSSGTREIRPNDDEMRRIMQAVTWALDRLGYSPSRYDEILGFLPRPVGSSAHLGEEWAPERLDRSRRLWKQVREEESLAAEEPFDS